MADDGTFGAVDAAPTGAEDFSKLSEEEFANEFLPDLSDLTGEAGKEPLQKEPIAEEPAEPEAEEVEEEEAEAEEVEEEAKEEEADPDEPKPEADKDGKPKATEFVAKDGDEEVDTSGVEITFTAAGKSRTLPLDRVVRLAQSGYYNEQLQSEVKETREAITETKQRAEQLEELALQRTALVRKLLEDDDFLLQQRERYLQAQSPEAKAERLERRLQEIEQKQEYERYDQERNAFVDKQLWPAMETVLKKYPSLTEEEVYGRWTMATARITENGTVPPKHWKAALEVFDTDIGPWAQQRHESRVGKHEQERAQLKTEARKAQVQATKAKRLVAKNLRPANASATSVPKRKPIVTVEDAMSDILQNDVAQLVRSMGG